jgi:hypothetical protein
MVKNSSIVTEHLDHTSGKDCEEDVHGSQVLPPGQPPRGNRTFRSYALGTKRMGLQSSTPENSEDQSTLVTSQLMADKYLCPLISLRRWALGEEAIE